MHTGRVELVPIPAGRLSLRDARTESSRDVELQAFEFATVTTTLEAYSSDVGAAQLRDLPAHSVTWLDAVQWCNSASRAAGLTPAYERSANGVTWDVSADGYRLPTEAEWEWACRAGTAGPTYGSLESIAWTSADSVSGPQPVARKAPNAYGLFDTIGNVWEWCWDYADTARYGDYRTLRGGGWADPAWSCRASVRRGSAPDAVLEDVGFRVARGAVGVRGAGAAQGWSAEADERRANISGPLPMGWTPLGRQRNRNDGLTT